MKVTVISNMFPSETSPNYGIFVQNFIDNLSTQSDFIVNKIVITGKGQGLVSKIIKYFNFFSRVIVALSKDDVDLYYVHYANHSLLPFLLMPKRIKKCIVNFHGGDLFPENFYARLISKLTKQIVCKCKGVVVPSMYFKQEVSEKIGVDKNLIFVSPSGGINNNVFFHEERIQFEMPSVVRIGYLGRLDKGKGFELIIPLAKMIQKSNISFAFSIIGGGSLMQQYIEKVNSLGLGDYFKFHGMQSHSKIPELLKELDVFIFPSYRRGESLGLVGLEAMACGIPVIGSDSGGISSYINDGINGFLFRPKSVEDLFDKFICFVNLNQEERNEMVLKAIQKAKEYESSIVNRNMIQYLQEI